jgi:hypothetical protein
MNETTVRLCDAGCDTPARDGDHFCSDECRRNWEEWADGNDARIAEQHEYHDEPRGGCPLCER